jgi:hypothetical protein
MFLSVDPERQSSQTENMEECWKHLPFALVERICSHLDSATRRDLGMQPRRLTQLPDLQLHRDKITDFGGSTILNLTTQGGEKVYQLMWTLGAFPGFFYQRTNRIRFMTIEGMGVVVWRDTEVHQNMFSYVVELE